MVALCPTPGGSTSLSLHKEWLDKFVFGEDSGWRVGYIGMKVCLELDPQVLSTRSGLGEFGKA